MAKSENEKQPKVVDDGLEAQPVFAIVRDGVILTRFPAKSAEHALTHYRKVQAVKKATSLANDAG